MIGAILGDVAGSIYEFHNINRRLPENKLWTENNFATDDSIATMAIAKALIDSKVQDIPVEAAAIINLRAAVKRFPNAGWGNIFEDWALGKIKGAYGSWGNGAAMRISPVAYFGLGLLSTLELAEKLTVITHNTDQAVAGAKCVAGAVWLAVNQCRKQEIAEFIGKYYNLKEVYKFDPKFYADCNGTVPVAMWAFLNSTSLEDCISLAISLGGDSDTVACIAGSVASAYYGVTMKQLMTASTYCVPDLFQYVLMLQSDWIEPLGQVIT